MDLSTTYLGFTLPHPFMPGASPLVPVIASLNGREWGGWLAYSRLLAEAGADALELNVYDLATGLDEVPEAISGSS